MRKRNPKKALDYCLSILDVPSVYKDFGFKTSWGMYKWRREGVPPSRVLEVVKAVREAGGEVTCHELRPDKFPEGA